MTKTTRTTATTTTTNNTSSILDNTVSRFCYLIETARTHVQYEHNAFGEVLLEL